ncbi:MAG: SRPBCC family protein [Pyrinomonadaceae bacterium]
MKQEKSITDILTNMNTNVSPTERIVSGVAGGALITYGAKRKDAIGVVLSIIGGGLALRGATGHCQVYDAMDINTATAQKRQDKNSKENSFAKNLLPGGKIHVKKSVTINKSPAEIYQFWRNFENLPQFMTHLESVTNTEGNRSHWKAKAPFGQTVEWDAEITSDQENERIGWKSIEGADVPNSGVVEFNPTVNRGTEVRVVLTYEAPGGKLGSLVAKLFGEEPSQQVYGDLCRLKSIMEAGEIIKVEGQTSGRDADKSKAKTANA